MESVYYGAETNGYYHNAPVLNQLILKGMKLGQYKIPSNFYHSFHSPQKIADYERLYLRELDDNRVGFLFHFAHCLSCESKLSQLLYEAGPDNLKPQTWFHASMLQLILPKPHWHPRPEALLDAQGASEEVRRILDCKQSFEAPKVIGKAVKIALCISGQLRGYQQVAPKWLQLLRDSGYEYEIFVHVWENIGNQVPIGKKVRAHKMFSGKFLQAWESLATSIPRNPNSEIWQLYPTLFSRYEKRNLAEVADLERVYQTEHVKIEDDNDPKFSFLKANIEKMRYKMEQCYQMAKEFSEFTHAIRTRPDKDIKLGQSLQTLMKLPVENHLYIRGVGYGQGAPRVGDEVAFGNAKNMDIYNSAYSTIEAIKCYRLLGLEGHTAHRAPFYNLAYRGIAVLELPLHLGGYIDPIKLTSEEIRELIVADASDRNLDYDSILLKALEEDIKQG